MTMVPNISYCHMHLVFKLAMLSEIRYVNVSYSFDSNLQLSLQSLQWVCTSHMDSCVKWLNHLLNILLELDYIVGIIHITQYHMFTV